MIEVSLEFKQAVFSALIAARENYTGGDAAFAKKHSIHPSVYSELKKGNFEHKISAAKWLELGRTLNVSHTQRKWNMARTEVFDAIEEQVVFCKEFSKARMFVDECAIGKTYSALYLARTMQNCFYLDGSQCETKNEFIRALAKSIGVEWNDTIYNIRENIKYSLRILTKPVIIIDEAGDLSHNSFLALKEFWNATDGFCGWYMMGSDGLRTKISHGKDRSKKQGYKELFSRFSSKYGNVVPTGKADKVEFYKKLIRDVLSVNVSDSNLINRVIRQCMTTDGDGDETGLRRAESLLILSQQ